MFLKILPQHTLEYTVKYRVKIPEHTKNMILRNKCDIVASLALFFSSEILKSYQKL